MNYTGKIFSVTQINNLAKGILENNFHSIAVEGEISGLTLHSSGHMYFTIKDAGASLDGIMYKTVAEKMAFEPERGMKVLIRGRISIFVKGGRFQITAWEMKDRGQGELEKKFIELKEKLRREGLFDAEHKKKIPLLPSFIGIVTSPTGAAVRDIINVVQRRFANVRMLIYPARVQGDGAANEICRGIEVFNSHYPAMDVMIVGRGGGSLEDLWPFNEESVARALSVSEIPVISAVGHEVDFTIADFVADLRAPTPSAAAELVVRERSELLLKLGKQKSMLINFLRSNIDNAANGLLSLQRSPVYRYPARMLEQREQILDYINENMQTAIKHLAEVWKANVNKIYSRLEALSPYETLRRGYSITYSADGISVSSAGQLSNGDRIRSVFYSGEVESEVKNIRKGKHG